jgi:hypothetical protein
MDTARAAHRRLDGYLRRLRAALAPLPATQAREIVEELRSHILDSVGVGESWGDEGVAEALRRLGPPDRLAAQYVAQDAGRRALHGLGLWRPLRAGHRWAAQGLAGAFILLGCLVGYAFAAAFAYWALAKPFAPARVGLWKLDDPADDLSFALGAVNQPGARELLGWWIIPLGLAAGVGLFFLTTRFGRWGLRQLRAGRAGGVSREGTAP